MTAPNDGFDERPVGLEPLHRKILEISETGMAGAEIVDGKLDAKRVQTLETVASLIDEQRRSQVTPRPLFQVQ